MQNILIQGDCLEVLKTLPAVRMAFADPPDNIGLKYDGYDDKMREDSYITWVQTVVETALEKVDVLWLSYNPIWDFSLKHRLCALPHEKRTILWRYTFGQYNDLDLGRGYRPILRINKIGTTWPEYRVESERQRIGDSRAKPDGRMPDDVWDFSRVVGNSKERRPWHPTQHPEALILRIIMLTCDEGDTIYDLFAGTGTVNRVCKFLTDSSIRPVNCIGIEQSETYCENIWSEFPDFKSIVES